MSNRLLTMKFMQRGAIARALQDSPDQPTAKRRKVGDRDAVEAALHEHEAKRQAALDRYAAEVGGEVRWTLEIPTSAPSTPESAVSVVYVGYAQIDDRKAATDRRLHVENGRIRTPNFKARDVNVCCPLYIL